MNYPSLLYLTEPETPAIDATVFEDVKLIHLVGGDVLDAMKYPLNAENITARQELFREMEDPAFSEWLHRLHDRIEDVARYDARMNSAAAEIERKCAFVGLLRAYIAFCREAAAREGKCALSSRFTAFFREEIRKPYFLRAEQETAEVSPRIGELSRSLFCVSGETLRVTVNPPESFVARIARCASELGLREPAAANISSRPLAQAIIEKTASMSCT